MLPTPIGWRSRTAYCGTSSTSPSSAGCSGAGGGCRRRQSWRPGRRTQMEDSPMSANSPARLATRKLGRAGVEVTELGLGTAPLGENWDIIEEEEASTLLRAAWD